MSNKKQQIPAIRFNGFTDAWEQRELKEILKVNSGRDYKHLGSGSVPVYGTGGYMLSVNDKLSDKDAIGIGRKGTIDKPQYLKAPFWTVDTLFFMIPLNNFDLQFLYTMTQKINWKKMDESTGVPSLSKAVIEKVNQNIPSYQEQIKIGGFFKQLDNTIALHQRQLDNYKELKKTMLQKMLPQNGEIVPKVRFSGFTENWKQHKLKELLIERNIKQTPTKDIPLVSFTVEDGVTPKSQRYDREFLVRDSEKKYKLTKLDDIVYNPANLKFGAIARNKLGTAVFSPIYITFETNQIPFFIELLVTRNDFINKSLKYQEGTVYERKAVKPEDFLSISTRITSIPEQNKIGEFFQLFDDCIFLHQKKIQDYQQIKKNMLQRMFV